MSGEHQEYAGLFEFNGTSVILKKRSNGKWKVLITYGSSFPNKATIERVDDFETAARLFEQTVRGLFYQASCFPVSPPLPPDVFFDEDHAYRFPDTDTGLIYISANAGVFDYDVHVTEDVIIDTKDWPYIKYGEGDPVTMRVRIFNTEDFKVTFRNVKWDNDVKPVFTRQGYDVIQLRSRGNGLVQGSFYLNVPHEHNDTKLLYNSSHCTVC